MRIRKNISVRFSGDIFSSSINSDEDGLRVTKEFAACKSCGSILSVRSIKLCHYCRNFLCNECIFVLNSNLLCRECVQELYPLEVYEYVLLKIMDRMSYVSIYELAVSIGWPTRDVRMILALLIRKGLVISRGWLFRRYAITVQGSAVLNLYDKIYGDVNPYR